MCENVRESWLYWGIILKWLQGLNDPWTSLVMEVCLISALCPALTGEMHIEFQTTSENFMNTTRTRTK